MVTELQQQVGKLGTNAIIINVIGCSVSTSKFDYCVSYITHGCFSIIIIFKCDYDIWGITRS